VPAEIFEISPSALSDMTVEHDQTTKIRGAEVRLWDKRSFDTPVFTSLGGPIDMHTTAIDKDHVQVTIVNKTKYSLHDCALVSDKGQNITIGTLAAGQTLTVKQPLEWAYKEATTSVRLPAAPADWQYINSVNTKRSETPDQVRNNLRYALTQALASTGSGDQNYQRYNMGYGEDDESSYGRATNAFVGWVDTGGGPLMDIQVDGKPAAGQEAVLLYVHIPAAGNLPPEAARAVNPFLADPILNLKEESPGPAGRIIQ